LRDLYPNGDKRCRVKERRNVGKKEKVKKEKSKKKKNPLPKNLKSLIEGSFFEELNKGEKKPKYEIKY
jgi:hypothetical protein